MSKYKCKVCRDTGLVPMPLTMMQPVYEELPVDGQDEPALLVITNAKKRHKMAVQRVAPRPAQEETVYAKDGTKVGRREVNPIERVCECRKTKVA